MLVAVLFLFSHGCERYQIIKFVHTESERFFDGQEIDNLDQQEHHVDGILFTIDIQPAKEKCLSVLLGFNSDRMLPAIRIVDARIIDSGKNHSFKHHQIGMDVTQRHCRSTDGKSRCTVRLFKPLPEEKIERFTGKNDFLIRVEMEMNGKIVNQEFHIRRKLKRTVFAFS